MKDFRQLTVWKKSHQLALTVYGITRDFPKEELYGLISQIRRASISIPTNIAEGCGRNSDADLQDSYRWQWVQLVKRNINSF